MKLRASFLSRHVPFSLMLALIAGCAGSNEFSDLRSFFDEVAAEPVMSVRPLPEFKPYESFKYGAANLRSPFQAPLVIASRADKPPPGSIRPPANHVKSYLEEMNLATLQLVGSLELRGQYYGLIKDGEGVVHQVGVGAYLGTQWGRVEKIEETRLELVEIVSNGGGGWLLRPRTIELIGTSEG